MGSSSDYAKATLLVLVMVCIVKTNMSLTQQQLQQQGGNTYGANWPITLTFSDTKTNSMLGEALLKRLYARIGFTDNIIRAEVDTLFEKLKDVIRKCERKRRRVRTYSHHFDPTYNSHQVNASLAQQYAPRRSTRY